MHHNLIHLEVTWLANPFGPLIQKSRTAAVCCQAIVAAACHKAASCPVVLLHELQFAACARQGPVSVELQLFG